MIIPNIRALFAVTAVNAIREPEDPRGFMKHGLCEGHFLCVTLVHFLYLASGGKWEGCDPTSRASKLSVIELSGKNSGSFSTSIRGW